MSFWGGGGEAQELGAGLALPPQAGDGLRRSLLCRLVPEWPWWLERAVNSQPGPQSLSGLGD